MRFYTSVSQFSGDFRTVFTSALGTDPAETDDPTAHDDLGLGTTNSALTPEQKELRKLAKRIIKAVQGSLEAAVRKEAELGGKPFEKELRDLELLLGNGMLSRRDSTVASIGEEASEADADGKRLQGEIAPSWSMPNGDGVVENGIQGPSDLPVPTDSQPQPSVEPGQPKSTTTHPEPFGIELAMRNGPQMESVSIQVDAPASRDEPGDLGNDAGGTRMVYEPAGHGDVGRGINGIQAPLRGPPTPPLSSSEDLLAPLSHGGIPWYLEPFDPVGTTIHEERWTGREVVRGMSEELSELDEEELRGLVDEELEAGPKPPETPKQLDPKEQKRANARMQPRGEKGRFKSMKNVRR